jgi:hypothetical protein
MYIFLGHAVIQNKLEINPGDLVIIQGEGLSEHQLSIDASDKFYLIQFDIIDSIGEFMNTYRQHVRQVSRETMEKDSNFEEVEESLLDANICWMVTDNIRNLLDLQSLETKETNSSIEAVEFSRKHLSQNNLIIVFQDGIDENDVQIGHDHWYALIGKCGYVYLVEHLMNECNSLQTFILEEYLVLLQGIMDGIIPDNFYGEVSRHLFRGFAHKRKTMSRNVVLNYIKKI